jgi:NTE family protein
MDSSPISHVTSSQQSALFRRFLSNYFGTLDEQIMDEVSSQCQWLELEGGDTLFSQGDIGDAAYFLISGRLCAIRIAHDGTRQYLGDIRPSETVGEIAVLSDDVRGATVLATRDSVVVRISTENLQSWFMQYPQLLLQTAKLIIKRTRPTNARNRQLRHISNITVLPLSKNINMAKFRRDFMAAMARCGNVLLLDPHIVDEQLQETGIAFVDKHDPERYRRLSAWLDTLEEQHDYVIYLANTEDDEWTQRCLRQSDRVLLLANATDNSFPSLLEQKLLNEAAKKARSDNYLVLWHPPETIMPNGTQHWLQPRTWIKEAIHVRQDEQRHMERLARIVTGNAIGLVLGSGGARGVAAVGVIQALEEASIPIDRVGGTSIGAIMAAGVALDYPASLLAEKVRTSFRQNPTTFLDLNILPILSIFQGKQLNRLLQLVFPQTMNVEDLWINFFCITSDMSSNEEIVHSRGSLWQAVRASAALPGVFPMVLLGKGLHVDGAFMNALPVDVMASLGAKKILAVDFSYLPNSKPDFDDMPSSIAFLLDKFFNNGRRRYLVPTLLSGFIQSSLMASSQKNMQSRADADVLFSPEVGRYDLLAWSLFDDLVSIGLRHARLVLANIELKLLPQVD